MFIVLCCFMRNNLVILRPQELLSCVCACGSVQLGLWLWLPYTQYSTWAEGNSTRRAPLAGRSREDWIGYKLGVMVYRCLHGQAPCYLADHLIPASDAAPRRCRLRSANLNCLTVPRCRLSTYGCRAFDYAGPTVWNSLPDELRNSDSFDSFKRFMKTILFSRY